LVPPAARRSAAGKRGSGGDILDQLLPEVLESQSAAMTQVIADAARNADLSTLDQSLQPGGDVHAVTKYVALLDHDVPGIDANAKLHGSIRSGIIALGHGVLNFDGTRNRVENADELGQHAVAGGIRDAPPILADQIVDHQSTRRQRRHRRFLVVMHQPTVTFDVCRQDRDKASLQLGCFHNPISCGRCRLKGAGVFAIFELWARVMNVQPIYLNAMVLVEFPSPSMRPTSRIVAIAVESFGVIGTAQSGAVAPAVPRHQKV
jgi:hypothetical protein